MAKKEDTPRAGTPASSPLSQSAPDSQSGGGHPAARLVRTRTPEAVGKREREREEQRSPWLRELNKEVTAVTWRRRRKLLVGFDTARDAEMIVRDVWARAVLFYEYALELRSRESLTFEGELADRNYCAGLECAAQSLLRTALWGYEDVLSRADEAHFS